LFRDIFEIWVKEKEIWGFQEGLKESPKASILYVCLEEVLKETKMKFPE